MLSEVGQTETTNTVWQDFHVESKKAELMETERRVVIARGRAGE